VLSTEASARICGFLIGDDSVILFGQSMNSQRGLSDEEFLCAVSWGRTAPRRLLEAAKQGNIATFCNELAAQYSGGIRRGGGKRVAGAKVSVRGALWSQRAFETTRRTAELVKLWEATGTGKVRARAKIGTGGGQSRVRGRANGAGKLPAAGWERRIRRWLDKVDGGESLSPFELLILFEILVQNVSDLPAETGFRLWRVALVASIEQSIGRDGFSGCQATVDQRLLVEGELPFLAGLLFAGVTAAAKYSRTGRNTLRKELEARTDTDGTPEAELLERLGFWLAPLVRSAEWAKHFRCELWDDDLQERYRFLIKSVARFCHSDGRLAMSNGNSCDVLSVLKLAAEHMGRTKSSIPLKYLLEIDRNSKKPVQKRRSPQRRSSSSRVPPVTQSDWAQVACLRNEWSTDADSLVVAHHGEMPLIDLTILGKPLLHGPWDVSIAIDGKPSRVDDDWICDCWFSDEDADFLELHTSIDSHLRIDRQMLLSREDHYLLFADVVSGPDGARIDYSCRLPVVDSVAMDFDTATRECVLKRPGVAARAFPLALPAERVQSASGELRSHEGSLELRQAAVGGLYAPLLIDWAPQRRGRYADWRTLTVTRQGQPVRSNEASGHRLRIGRHQLVFYRSLKKTEDARAVLGHHTTNETVVGSFGPDGELDPVVVVE